MQKEIHIISIQGSDRQAVIADNELIKEGNTYSIERSQWEEDYHYDDGGYYITTKVPVEIDKSFVMIVSANFIIAPDKEHAYTSRTNRGMGDVNGLMYAYSVTIIEKLGNHQLRDKMVVHTESGVKTTKFSMYSYHFNNPFRYNEKRLVHEVEESIDINGILLPGVKSGVMY